MSDTQHLFGKILTEGQGDRDAVHVAVVPLEAACLLGPGDHIGIDTGGRADDKARGIGIVDPFLTVNVQRGQRFFMFLYPNTITSLKHRWTHPAFPEEFVQVDAAREAAEREARAIASRWDGPDYDTMLEAITHGHGHATWRDGSDDLYDDYAGSVSIYDDRVYVGGRDASGTIPDRFWDLMQIITGRTISVRPEYFSCSC